MVGRGQKRSEEGLRPPGRLVRPRRPAAWAAPLAGSPRTAEAGPEGLHHPVPTRSCGHPGLRPATCLQVWEGRLLRRGAGGTFLAGPPVPGSVGTLLEGPLGT